jgi:hypothetical protein
MTKPRVSTTGIATTAPITLYANSPENTDLGKNFKVVIPGNVVGPMYTASADLSTSDIDPELDVVVEVVDEDVAKSTESDGGVIYFNAPSISDISIISNSVVYSDAGIPSVTLKLKVKNSSGTKLKGINVRIQSV